MNDDSLFLFAGEQAFFMSRIPGIFGERTSFERRMQKILKARANLLIIRMRHHPSRKEATWIQLMARM